MFKTNSKNIQRRTDNAKERVKLDPSTFKSNKQFDDTANLLGEDRAKVQEQIFLLNNQLKEAQARARNTGMFTNQNYYAGLHAKRNALVLELREIEAKQTKLKIMRRNFREGDELSFPNVFIKMAKTMLADDVYMRVFAATSHFIEEADVIRADKPDAA